LNFYLRNEMPFKIIIVGTGIAGLSAAITLSDKGHAVTVVEATSELKATGGIIMLQPNANRVLDHMGVYEEISRIGGVQPFPGGIKSYKDGQDLFVRKANDSTDEFGYPCVLLLAWC
jgi:salicylate hydroxylase